jgi:hypothetical protein
VAAVGGIRAAELGGRDSTLHSMGGLDMVICAAENIVEIQASEDTDIQVLGGAAVIPAGEQSRLSLYRDLKNIFDLRW